MTKEPKKSSYTASDIYVLEGLEPVRKRPGMYIGGTGIDGLHHLIWEVFDNSLDEAMGGHADHITVTLLPDEMVSVKDNGRGIPVEKHKQTGVSTLETVMTTLHAGGKFGGEAYKVSGGLHGVGVSVVNALSSYLKAEVHRDGAVYMQEYVRGKPKKPVKKIGDSKFRGTIVTFQPDAEIFKERGWKLDTILAHLRQQAYLTRGITINIIDARVGVKPPSAKEPQYPSHSFHFEGGLVSYVSFLNHGIEPKHRSIFYAHKEQQDIDVEIAFQYVDDLSAKEISFANNIHTVEGGTHMTGFKAAITRTLNDYARKNSYLKEKDENLSGDDVREGLVAILSVKLREPQFEGQTKAKLGTPEARAAVETVMNLELADWLDRNPTDARSIMDKVILASKARAAAKAARDTVLRKGALDGFSLPGKLADCSSRSAEESELFIVEGDSAGGCFSGDTKVALTDGRDLSFRELCDEHASGKQHWCYTIARDGDIAVAPLLHPRVTRRDASVVKVILDTGEEVVCTPDHKFMLRDGMYCEASHLQAGDSLMPLYRKSSRIGGRITLDIEGYEKLRQQTNDKSLLRTETILHRFFEGNRDRLFEAIQHHNHKVLAVVSLEETTDVYDLEVPDTHNFALASGVFVHNSAKQGRDRNFQAILPLRGKILNVERARIDKMLASLEVRALIIAMGTAIAEEFELAKLRYHKIIIMTDADVDGAHIRTLLLTLFYRHFPQLFDGGHIYIAQPPLYRIAKGGTVQYVYSDEEKEKIVAQYMSAQSVKVKVESEDKKKIGTGDFVVEDLESEEPVTRDSQLESPADAEGLIKVAGLTIQRYKGLGEMNPEQLWDTTMNPANRVLLQVTIEDAQEADRVFDVLMGAEVAPRKKFIQTHARSVQNLDI